MDEEEYLKRLTEAVAGRPIQPYEDEQGGAIRIFYDGRYYTPITILLNSRKSKFYSLKEEDTVASIVGLPTLLLDSIKLCCSGKLGNLVLRKKILDILYR